MSYFGNLADMQAEQYVEGVEEYRARIVEVLKDSTPHWAPQFINEAADNLAIIYRWEVLNKTK